MEMFVPSAINKSAYGTVSPTGTATTVFTIAHGLGAVPAFANVAPKNTLSAALYYITTDATNITITYLAGLTGTLSLSWFAFI